nr:MAG TPA: hypothetical protein [Caudoviricetes sp.]DAZ76981.1 MAG TPA: hypothetical protein [Caudoviricetes sp.]
MMGSVEYFNTKYCYFVNDFLLEYTSAFIFSIPLILL